MDYQISPADVAALLLLPTLRQGQGDDLKLQVNDDERHTAYSVWLPRLTDADRAEYAEHTGVAIGAVDVERLVGGRWVAAGQGDLNRALYLARKRGLIG